MRGMVSSIVLGSIMVAIVVGFAFYLHTAEIQKERTAVSLSKQMEEVRGADILRYYIAAVERSYYSESLAEEINFLSTEEVKDLRKDPLSLVPTEGYEEYLKDLFNGALKATVEYTGNPPKIKKGWYKEFPELNIERNAELRITFNESGTIYSIPLTSTVYVLPIPLKELSRAVSQIKTRVLMDVYMGFYVDSGELRYREPTQIISFGGSSFGITDVYTDCVPENEIVSNVERAREKYLNAGLTQEIEREVARGLPPEVKDVTCNPESLLVFPVVDTNQGFPAGFEAKTVQCKAIIELSVPGGEELNVTYPFRVEIEDTFPHVPKRMLKLSLVNGHYTLSGTCP